MTINPSEFSETLHLDQSGVWVGQGDPSVSYPSGGHQSCFEVEASSFWFNHRNRCIIDVVRNHPPEGPIFDIGGGNGYVTAALDDAGLPAALVEPGGNGVSNARRRGVATVIRAEAQAAGFSPSSLPAVGLFDVLEHIEDDVGMLDWLSATMTPKAKLFLTVPAYGWLWSNEDVHAGHFRRYAKNDLSEKLAAAGFRVDFASYFFSPLVLPLLLIRSIPTRLGIRPNTTGEKATAEHSPPGGGLLTAILEREARRIKSGKQLPFGTSLILAATKH